MNTRTLVSIPDHDKAWLDAEAAARGVPMTHVVRQAVAEYRAGETSRRAESLAELIEATAGLFARRDAAAQDGAALQRRLRAEWERGSGDAAPARPRSRART
jgi:hypothetical protein